MSLIIVYKFDLFSSTNNNVCIAGYIGSITTTVYIAGNINTKYILIVARLYSSKYCVLI